MSGDHLDLREKHLDLRKFHDFLKKTLGFLGNYVDFGPAFGEILSKNIIRIRVSKTQI